MMKLSRRELLQSAGAISMAPRAAAALDSPLSKQAAGGAALQESGSAPVPVARRLPTSCNVLFILTDQERYFGEWPVPLPGRERLRKSGVYFKNHMAASCACSPSRSVIYTGQHIQHTGVVENAGWPWAPDLPPETSTIGKMLRVLGYYTAYEGKWHLNGRMEHENKEWEVTEPFMDLMNEYGFADYIGVGDLIARDRGGYKFDGLTTAAAIRWLRGRGQVLNQQATPWYLAVNLVNPHDIMFFNTDTRDEAVQSTSKTGAAIHRSPDHEIYRAEWNSVPLSPSWQQSLVGPGRPMAHQHFRDSLAQMVGLIPNEEARWRRHQNYYLNAIRDSDRHIADLMLELDGLGLTENTIVVFTADHGELAGAHGGLWSKGATAYQEQTHVPLIVSHPALSGGTTCSALTSHVDLVPTMLGLTGRDVTKAGGLLGGVVGKDFSSLLLAPKAAGLSTVRDGALYNYNMLSYYDPGFLKAAIVLFTQRKRMSKEEFRSKADKLRPDWSYRGAIRSVFDGRYRFSRYFSLREHHAPKTLESLLAHNDLELYDLTNDPNEVENLAVDLARHRDLIAVMNDRLNALIETEVGADDGSFMPFANGITWKLDPDRRFSL